ncbi:50S ribosomal protein L10 [Candidatus Woesearchaeota archaeon]|nr:MAG: large subunit ribosomal protein L10 [archaeon GW2011_AR4]MBS3130674.1 50S ribosomal protein L10 [Candidatus Woesearchaeota archaeon]HIH37702.1 50S ribosomal protein L10 [Candidatus Woesearchaeota archaeon]HIH48623.1 50S ribosomal protein L10 [Candidatus Woesearchaeota archaeon]HIJ03710.1 50S ribosomal protein L10 [Candidatus Woesearchaeota archaeon]
MVLSKTQKKDLTKKLAKELSSYPIIGIVNMANLPAKQLQAMRSKLRGPVVVKMVKKTLMKHAFKIAEKDKPGISQLADRFEGMPALILSKDNPFKLFKTLKANQSPAPAKAGQIAPDDITIPKGKTPFSPGPIISELGGVGLKTSVQDGKVAIVNDKVVTEKGHVINAKVASVLTRLSIMPMKIGLDLVCVIENGVIYGRDVLDIDETIFLSKVQTAARHAVNLSMEAAYPTKDTMSLLIAKAFTQAKGVAVESAILNEKTTPDIIAKAARQALALQGATS